MKTLRTLLCVPALGALGCMTTPLDSAAPGPPAASFGTTQGGEKATAWTLRNESGMEIVVTDFGATLVSVRVPDRTGEFSDVVLGFDDVGGYEGDGNQYFGCTVGLSLIHI